MFQVEAARYRVCLILEALYFVAPSSEEKTIDGAFIGRNERSSVHLIGGTSQKANGAIGCGVQYFSRVALKAWRLSLHRTPPPES